MIPVLECLLSKCNALSSIPSTTKKKKVHWAAVETQGYLKELPEIVPELRISLAQAAKM
jgi:hypothetical protein